MSDLFIHSDGHDLCVWQDQPDGEPACLMTKQETHSVVWDFLARHINQRDEPLPEPTDPAVRVVDADGEVAARIGDEWISRTWGPLCWEQAWHEAGPLVVQTDLDAPTPDADRPLKVGHWCRVSPSANSLTRGRRVEVRKFLTDDVVEVKDDWGDASVINTADLTRIPGGEA